MQVGGDVLDGTEHGNTEGERGAQGEQEVAVGEEVHGHDRLCGAVFNRNEDQGRDGGCDEKPNNLRGVPGVLIAAPDGGEHERAGSSHENDAAQVVDLPLFAVFERGVWEQENDGKDCQYGKRQVEPECPTPTGTLGDPPADERPGDRGEGEDAADNTHIFTAFAGGDHICDHGLGENHETATADSLERAGDDQPGHIGSERADDRSRHEGEDGKNQEGFTPELVGEFAVHRHGDGGEQDEGGNYPAHMLHAMQFAHNGRQ